MREKFVCKWLVAAVLVGVQGWPALAQVQQPGASPAPNSALSQPAPLAPAAASAVPADSPAPTAASAAPAQTSVGAEQLLKLLQAGVAKDVIRAYIQTATTVPPLSATDIVTLKEHGLPDDLTVALMKRQAELAAQADHARASNAAPARLSGTVSLDALVAALRTSKPSGGYLDPEGYDYFQYYYLNPRAIASANQRIFSSYPPSAFFPGYPIGYGSPWAFRPRPFGPTFPGP